MDIQFKRLSEVDHKDLIDLMNNPLVRRQMPLLKGIFTEEDCAGFIAAKEQIWSEHGYGPWAFVIDGKFVGWGGLQPEQGEADLALVLHPDFWGVGKRLYQTIVDEAFDSMELETITVLLPPTRTRISGLVSLGFIEDGILKVSNNEFVMYRLNRRKG